MELTLVYNKFQVNPAKHGKNCLRIKPPNAIHLACPVIVDPAYQGGSGNKPSNAKLTHSRKNQNYNQKNSLYHVDKEKLDIK